MLRRAALTVAAVLGLLAPAAAEEPKTETAAPVELMFVQQAAGMKYDGKTLTLEGIAPATIFFSDRPQRISGHLTRAQFVDLWNKTKDSFAADPPNAALSIVTDKEAPPVVVELTSIAEAGDSLSYGVRVLEGTLPESAGAVALFIDGWRWGYGWRWGWGPVVRPVPYYPGPAMHCHYSYYWNHPVCRGVW